MSRRARQPRTAGRCSTPRPTPCCGPWPSGSSSSLWRPVSYAVRWVA